MIRWCNGVLYDAVEYSTSAIISPFTLLVFAFAQPMRLAPFKCVTNLVHFYKKVKYLLFSQNTAIYLLLHNAMLGTRLL